MVGLDPATLDDDNPSNHTFSHGTDQARYLCWYLRMAFGLASSVASSSSCSISASPTGWKSRSPRPLPT